MTAELQSVPSTLKTPSDPCHALVKTLYGRVLQYGSASASVVNKRGLILASRHQLGDGPGTPNGVIPMFIGTPVMAQDSFQSEPFAFQPLVNGTGAAHERNQSFRLFTAKLTKIDYKDNYAGISPERDFSVGLMTNTKLAPEQIGNSIDLSPLRLDRTTATLSPGASVVGEPVILLGYPRTMNGTMAFSAGTILTDEAAVKLIALDPTEKLTPYNKDVEFVVAMRSTAGMSGGGVFNQKGEFLGHLVRGNDEPVNGKFFARVVRYGFVIKQMEKNLATIGSEDADYLGTTFRL